VRLPRFLSLHYGAVDTQGYYSYACRFENTGFEQNRFSPPVTNFKKYAKNA
jgi:hypothetical protein